MKKSEMIDKLCCDLLVMDGFLNYSYGGHEMPTPYEEIAEEIIDYLVNNGMLPPEFDNYNTTQSERTFSSDSDWVYQGKDKNENKIYSLSMRKWEEE